MEVTRAITTENMPMLYDRLRQAVNGLVGKASLRFFAAGSARRQLAESGYDVCYGETERWGSLVTVERTLFRSTGDAPWSRHPSGDYVEVDDQFAAIRERAKQILPYLLQGRLPRQERAQLLDEAAIDNPYAPLLVLLVMADVAFGRFSGRASFAARAFRRAAGSALSHRLDWERLRELQDLLSKVANADSLPPPVGASDPG
jgi:hypothetical protein